MQMKCPKCEAEMEEITVSTLKGKVVIDRCTHCFGIWFDHGEAETLKDKWMSEFVDLGDPKVGREFDKIKEIKCPRCPDTVMRHQPDAKQPQIRYEVCDEHGMFLDAGEYTDYANDTLSDIFKGFIARLEDRFKKQGA